MRPLGVAVMRADVKTIGRDGGVGGGVGTQGAGITHGRQASFVRAGRPRAHIE